MNRATDARHAAALGALLVLTAGDVLSQGQSRPAPPMLPLEQQAHIKASNTGRAGDGDNPGDGDQFGSAVALSGDGRILVVGAHNEDGADNAVDDSGAAYVFMH